MPWGDSTHSVYAESLVLSSSLVNSIHSLPWVSACSWIPFFDSTDKNPDSCLKSAMTVRLSPSPPVCLSIGSVLFSSSKVVKLYWFHYFASLWGSFLQSWRARALTLITDLVARIQCSHHHDLMLNLWLVTTALLQAAAGGSHLRSLWV